MFRELRKPYNSWGNGSAMRTSAVGWMFDTLEETERIAALQAGITHNHPEGIKVLKLFLRLYLWPEMVCQKKL